MSDQGLSQSLTFIKGERIQTVHLEENNLYFSMSNGASFRIFDSASYCCEKRWMHTDDDLSYYSGAVLLRAEVRDGPTKYVGVCLSEEQFLVVTTDKGSFTVVNYNEHNGSYAGFRLEIRRN